MDFITDDHNGARQNYLGRVRYIDASFGRLVAQLEQRGMYENAVIVMHADNGAGIPAFFFFPPSFSVYPFWGGALLLATKPSRGMGLKALPVI